MFCVQKFRNGLRCHLHHRRELRVALLETDVVALWRHLVKIYGPASERKKSIDVY